MMRKLLTVLVFLVLPLVANASTAAITVDTGVGSINALEGTLHVPQSVHVKDIYTGDSMVVFWINGPVMNAASGTISFAGLTPGGFRGKRAVFTISGDFDKKALASISFSDVIALKNDGEGSTAKVKLAVSDGNVAEDTAPPEPFSLTVSESADVFGGKPFVSFATQDKITGVARYEAAEKFLGAPKASDWHAVTSPYEMMDRLLIKEVYIRAVDSAGNTKVESVSLPRRVPLMFFLAIIIAVPCILALRSYTRYS